MKTGVELITDERRRQIEEEGWDDDSEHCCHELATAGACYAIDTVGQNRVNIEHKSPRSYQEPVKAGQLRWPWDAKWWKPTPKDPVRQLVKAGALIAAEIDRLQALEGE